MGIVNRRNAAIGWLVWKAGKRVAKRKARQAVPTIDTDTKRPNRSAIFTLVGLVAGVAAWLWTRRQQADEDEPPA